MNSINVEMLQVVAQGLEELADEMVFVGGAVTELYAKNPSLAEIRPTVDVDCVIELSSRKLHGELEERLRSKGFRNDTSPNAPICRWLYKKVKVDIMPSDSDVLGFSNQWYPDGIRNKVSRSSVGRRWLEEFQSTKPVPVDWGGKIESN